MVKSSQMSIYGLKLINAFLANRYYSVIPNTTLNEKFNIMTDQHIPKGTVEHPTFPKLRYFVIGTGGLDVINSNADYKMSGHRVLDAALFNHIPFILRPVINDITPEQRLKYRLRKELIIDGQYYYAYYAKVIDLVDYRDYNFIIKKVDGQDILSIMDEDSYTFLNPVPYFKPTDKDAVLNVDTVINRYKMEFNLSVNEQIELQNVLSILQLDTTKITEIGVCHGYDVIAPYGYETIDTQISYFVDIDLDTQIDFDLTKPFERNIELGGAEPFFR